MESKKKRIVMSRLVDKKNLDQDNFDFEFWNQIGPQRKFEAAWEMVCDLENWNSSYVTQSRLRRSVCLLKPREG